MGRITKALARLVVSLVAPHGLKRASGDIAVAIVDKIEEYQDLPRCVCPECGQTVVLPAPGVVPRRHNVPDTWIETMDGVMVPEKCRWLPPTRQKN